MAITGRLKRATMSKIYKKGGRGFKSPRPPFFCPPRGREGKEKTTFTTTKTRLDFDYRAFLASKRLPPP